MDRCTRVLLGVSEHRRDLDISLARLSVLSRVPRGPLARLDRGELWNVEPADAVQAAMALLVLDLYGQDGVAS